MGTQSDLCAQRLTTIVAIVPSALWQRPKLQNVSPGCKVSVSDMDAAAHFNVRCLFKV